jgi:hypothetical protein
VAVFAYIQSAKGTSTTALAFGATNTAGHMIVVAEAGFQTSITTAVSDSQGNSYSLITKGLTSWHINVFLATNIVGGTNTITCSGASATNNDIIIAEYAAPVKFLVDGAYITSNGLQIGTATIKYLIANEGTAALPSEVLIIPIVYDASGDHSPYTISGGTVRQSTHEADNAALWLGDFDTVSPSGVITSTASAGGATWQNGFQGIVCYVPSTGGGGGGVILGDMSAGMRG